MKYLSNCELYLKRRHCHNVVLIYATRMCFAKFWPFYLRHQHIWHMYNERRTHDLHRYHVLCIWSRSTLLDLNKIPCLFYEQLFVYTTIWFKRNILLGSILSLSYYLLCKFVTYAHVFTTKLIVLIDKLKSNIFFIRITKHPNIF